MKLESVRWLILAFMINLFFSVLAYGAEELSIGPLKFGGALRFNYIYKDWDEAYKNAGEIALDTARININLEENFLIGSLEYRYYRDKHSNGHDYAILHDGWLGLQLDSTQQIQAGVQRVPFGILPYASHNWFFQLGYYVGLEDDYDLGLKYLRQTKSWDIQAAWYLTDEGNSFGDSDDSARYSYDLVREGTNGNDERNQLNFRLTRTLILREKLNMELGFSLQYGKVPNRNTGRDGSQSAFAIHLNGTYDRWNLMLQGVKYDYNVENDPLLDASTDGSFVVMGAFDAAYHVASKGFIYSAGIAYSLPVKLGPISDLTFYNDYSLLAKDDSTFVDSQQNVLGMAITAGKFYTYVDLASGKNHPWLGGDFTNGLATGNTTDGWHTRFNINIGFYF